MSKLNKVPDEMLPTLGSIAIDGAARGMLLQLRSFRVPLIDCVQIARQIELLATTDSEWVLKE